MSQKDMLQTVNRMLFLVNAKVQKKNELIVRPLTGDKHSTKILIDRDPFFSNCYYKMR